MSLKENDIVLENMEVAMEEAAFNGDWEKVYEIQERIKDMGFTVFNWDQPKDEFSGATYLEGTRDER